MIPKITLTDTPDEEQLRVLSRELALFNEVGSGRANDYRSLAVFVENPETGETLGGLWGWTSFSFLHVSVLYLSDELRGLGLGRRLMMQAEEEAIGRGCHGAWIDTFSFQARGFYERLGYEVFGTLDEYPPGHSRFFLKKKLGSKL